MFIYLVNKTFYFTHILQVYHLEACESSKDDFLLNIFVNVYGYVRCSFKVYVNGYIDCLL